MGLPEPQEFSSMPSLCLVQEGIQRVHIRNSEKVKICLPITPSILHRIIDTPIIFDRNKEHWAPYNNNDDIVMLSAAAKVCFFLFSELEKSH